MRYLMLICGNEELIPQGRPPIDLDGCSSWVQKMSHRDVLRGGAGLRPTSDATTVRVRQGDMLLTDGPFAETKDQIAGFNVIECADLDAAIEIAAQHPAARFGSIEIRPISDP